uniref:LysR family transcriptional regulator n=1 Tax=Burkholderia anthina TaxID=179879 RepID=UPI00158C7A9A|nr:LysR family transcriptional regulator [Burkholderia anthina]
MNVTLRQLRAFVAVARTGSFTLAAGNLSVTQSALSGLIKELEEVIGLKVVDRKARRVRLSDVGADIYPLIEKILGELDTVTADLLNRKNLRTGTVRVAAPQLLSSTVLPAAIAAFGKQYPGIHVQVSDCMVDNVTAHVVAREVDFGIGPERDTHCDIDAAFLFERPFIAVLPPGHVLEEQAKLRWEDLAALPFISLRGQFTENLSGDLRATRDFNLSPSSEVAFMSTALSMVNAGLGVTVCLSYARSLVSLYGLQVRPLVDPVITRAFYIFTHSGRSLSPAAQAFHDFLLQHLQQSTDTF